MGSELPDKKVNEWLNANFAFIGDHTKRSVRGCIIVFLSFLVLGDLNQDRLQERMVPRGPQILMALAWTSFAIGAINAIIAVILFALGGKK